MIWKHGMIGIHKTKRSLYIVLQTKHHIESGMCLGTKSTISYNITTAIPLESYMSKTPMHMELLEPVENLEPLGELQELLYG